jgi:cytoskeletal protein RodZ
MSEDKKAFGLDLSRLRTERGMGLEELASATKVRVTLLRALEEGRFEALPPAVFVEGYLKVCARYLGADPARLVERYRNLAGVRPEGTPSPPVSKMPRREQETGRVFKWMGVLALLGGLGYASYVLMQQLEPTLPASVPSVPKAGNAVDAPDVAGDHLEAGELQVPSQPGPATDSFAPGAQTDVMASVQGESSASVGSPLSPPPPPFASSTPPPQDAEPEGDLVLAATDFCWCEIWADGRRVLYRQVAPGERLVFSGGRFQLSLGNAGAVSLHYRGASVPLPAEPGRVVKGLELPSSGAAPQP